MGAGHTFGPNYWYNLTNAEGLYPLAHKVSREIVGGTCHTVGIVGWTLVAGKGWTTPMYGYGVDQLLHVDIVKANGTITSANFTYNEDLFWAIRGGGGGFGVITSMKIKLHKPVCGTMEKCYSFWNSSWVGAWTGEKEQLDEIKDVLNTMFDWQDKYSTYWNSFIDLSYNPPPENTFKLSIISGHFGTEDMNQTNFNSFKMALRNLNISNAHHTFNGNHTIDEDQPPTITDKYYCEIFPDPKGCPKKM